jgi:hypothetical protein
MTLVVVWYREEFDNVWAVADTRISRVSDTASDKSSIGVLTDSGPKIFPISVTCRHGKSKIRIAHQHTFGFAFAGFVLAAMSTHAFASACTDNLFTFEAKRRPPSLEAIAEVYRRAGDYYIKDICSRAPSNFDHALFFFQALIFGFCPVRHSYELYQLQPVFEANNFVLRKIKMELAPKKYFPIGSGTESFVTLSEELQQIHSASPDKTGVMLTMKEYLKRAPRADVGGHYQIGIAGRKGFSLMPVVSPRSDQHYADFTHLGIELTNFDDIDGYGIGHTAVGPDIAELTALRADSPKSSV